MVGRPRGTASALSVHSRKTIKDAKDTLVPTRPTLMNIARPRRPLRWLQRGLAAALLTYGALLALIYTRQEALLFHPEPLPADFSFAGRYTPEQDFETLRIPVDGAELDALLFRQPASRGLVFYLHGNTGNLATWTTHVALYHRLGFDLFMLDYRGFGRSGGRIDGEAQLHADVRAAWERIAPAYAGRPVVILGRSLGSGLATRLARDLAQAAPPARSPDLLVLVSPYASMLRLARENYPLVPGALLRYPLRSDLAIGALACPVLILHGARDAVTPLAHAEALRAASGGRAELLTIADAAHDDIHLFPAYGDGLARRFGALRTPVRAGE